MVGVRSELSQLSGDGCNCMWCVAHPKPNLRVVRQRCACCLALTCWVCRQRYSLSPKIEGQNHDAKEPLALTQHYLALRGNSTCPTYSLDTLSSVF